jgi:CO/xanthine dehydrogenase Mo-binding subunit
MVTGIKINAAINLGAYAINADEMLDHVNLGILGVYKTKNIRYSSVAVISNIPPQGPFAGFGLAQGFFARECHESCISDRLNRDPAKWRKEKIIKASGQLKDTIPTVLLMDTVTKMSDYSRKWDSYELLRQSRKSHSKNQNVSDTQPIDWAKKGESLRGIGIAVGCQANGLLYIGQDKGTFSVELTLKKDTLEINTSMANSGMDCCSMWKSIAVEILGIDKEMVQITCNDNYPDSGPSTVSRASAVIAKLVEQACVLIRKKRLHEPLPITVRKMIRPPKNTVLDANFSSQENKTDQNSLIRPSCASAVVEIEISPIEYLPRIRGVWMCIDGGKIISEDHARRSIKTSAVQALGWAYREQINYVTGEIPIDQIDNFDIPGPQEIPPIIIEFIPGSSDEMKGVGDLPFSCIPAAYVQAVSQAMDHHFESIPLRALDIWYAGIKKKEGI